MQVIVEDSAQAASFRCAEIIRELLATRPDAKLAMASGKTHLGLYRMLIQMSSRKLLSFERATLFGQNEFVGLRTKDLQSCGQLLETQLLIPLRIPEAQVHLWNGAVRDLNGQCEQFEQRIVDAGGIDLQVLGVGMNGHIALCEPGSPFNQRCAVVNLHPDTLSAIGERFSEKEIIPTRGLTMGLGTILESRVCLLLVTGEAKAHVIERLMNCIPTCELPVSILRLHPNACLVCDRAATARIS